MTATGQLNPKHHVLGLDGLRGFAVIAVLLLHIHVIRGGFIGVDVFFVLSGFLITSFLYKEFQKTGCINFRIFYWKRGLRLMPALFMCVAVYVSINSLLGLPFSYYGPPSLSAISYTMNWTAAFHWVDDSLLGHTWSLAVEMQFYLLWPVTALYLFRQDNNKRKYMIIFIAILLSVVWRCYLTYHYGSPSVDRTYRGLDTRLDALLIGAVTSLLIAKGAKFYSVFKAFISCAFLGFIVLREFPGTLWIHAWGLTIVALCSAYIIGHVSQNRGSVLARALSFAPLVYIGKISYGLYLYHFPIIRGLEAIKVRHAGLIGLVLSISVASASYHFVEQRFLLLKPKSQSRNREFIATAKQN